jgi:hypothetical protein
MEAGADFQEEAVLVAVAVEVVALAASAVEASVEVVPAAAGNITNLIYLFRRNSFSIFQ